MRSARRYQTLTHRAVLTGALAVGGVLVPLAGPGATSAAAAPVTDPAGYVNPLIGSSNDGETFPGATLPFGMVQWSPENSCGNQTRTCEPGGYRYEATRIRGFSLTHLSGTGCAGAFGDVPFFPYAGTVNSSPSADRTDSKYASDFSHDDEVARAGYYSVKLASGVRAELTATTRTGSGRFSFPAGRTASLLVRTSNSEVGSSNAVTRIDVANRSISGSVTGGNFCGYINQIGRRSYYTVHFHAVFDQPFTGTGTWKDGRLRAGSTSASGGTTYGTDGWPPPGRGSGGYVTFGSGQTVNVRVGISFVSAANARANLAAENPPGTTLETVRQRAYDEWKARLRRITVDGGTENQRTTFYTALYHSLLHPNVFSDVTGQYVGMDQRVHSLTGGQRAQYANFSGWDVYRSQLQLVTWLEPEVGSEIAQSLLNQATQNNGVWDRWTHAAGGTHVMTGDPAHSALSSIYAFGGTGFDVRGALASMVHAATVVTPEDRSREGWPVMVVGERPSLDQYLRIHYVPSDGNAWGGAGETLEDVAADFGIAQLAGRIGDVDLARQFLARAQYWRNVFNPSAHASGGYIQERHSSGRWESFDPASGNGFAEGSSAQYTWNVPHNIRGLFDAMGGNARANARLDAFFHLPGGGWALTGAGGMHAELDNEPSVASPWLYNWSGRPYQTQETVRQVVNTLWSNTPGGIPGQDDLGAMSSWYVFAAMGLYPEIPGRAELVLASPLFPKITVTRSNGRTLTIDAPGASAGNKYVQSLTVNSAPSTKPWLSEQFVTEGGTLAFTLGSSPNRSWGSAPGDAPPSFDAAGAAAAAPARPSRPAQYLRSHLGGG